MQNFTRRCTLPGLLITGNWRWRRRTVYMYSHLSAVTASVAQRGGGLLNPHPNILGVTISDKLSVSDRPHQLVCTVCSIHAIRTLRTHVSHMACARRRVFRSVVAKLTYTHAVNACGALLRQLIGSEWRQSSAGEFTLDCAVRIS